MNHRPRRGWAALLANLSLVVLGCTGCTRIVPTSPGDSPTPVGVIKVAPDDGARSDARHPKPSVTVLLPSAIASIRHFPELGITDGGGKDGDAQSTYFRTTPTNREFRRGFAEFAIPKLPGRLLKATLVLREARGGVADPRPPDVHELSSYTDVDLDVTPADFDRATTPLATFETDVNEDQRTFRIDVTDLVARAERTGLGFRVKLAVDPGEMGFVPLGSAFSGSSTPPGVVIEVITTAHVDGI